MYANLRVEYAGGRRRKPLCAHEVEVREDGTIVVHLDDPEDEGSYAAPVGEKVLPAGTPLRITADF